MKKMTVRDPKKTKYEFAGSSGRKGIIFRVIKHVFYDQEKELGIITQFPDTFACVEKSHKIKIDPENSEQIIEESRMIDERITRTSKKIKYVSDILSTIFCMIFILTFAMTLEYNYLTNILIFMSFVLMGISEAPEMFYTLIARLKGDKEIIQSCKFHSAEHAVINAYYDLNRVPTIDEIKKYSNFNYQCNVPNILKTAWYFIGVGLCCLLPGFLHLIAAIIVLFVSQRAYKKKKLFFLEIITLSKPTDFEYNVAIQGLTSAIEKVKDAEKQMVDFSDNSIRIEIIEINADGSEEVILNSENEKI